MPASTTSVTSASTTIATVSGGEVVEVHPIDGDVWVHLTGGTAAAEAADCIKVLQDKPVEIVVDMGNTALTAIRNGASNVKVVAWIKP